MSHSWDAPLQQLNDQIKDLQKALESNSDQEKEHLHELELARQRLKSFMETPQMSGLAELPRLLQSVLTQQAIGVIILGEDSKILLFNAFADRVFGHSLADVGANGVQTGLQLFTEDKESIYSNGAMPWEKALSGEEVPQLQLYLKRPDLPDGMWISITCTTLRSSISSVSGAVALVVDVTEYVQIGEQLKLLCQQMTTQMKSMETAREELKVLTDKLGTRAVEPNGGDTAASASAAPALSPLTRPPSAPIDSENKTVLVVDDIPVNQKLLIMHLKKMGFQVEAVFNGKEALEAVLAKEYCLVFMDCDMPVMNGYESTIAIRQAEIQSGKHTPIVAMTSYDRVGDRERCLSVGMDEYLTKGVTQKRLQEVIQWCQARNVSAQPAAAAAPQEEEKDELLDLDNLLKSFGQYELEEILKLFLLSATTLTSCLQFAIEDRDVESISHFAYSLKGPCASIGLNQLAKLAGDITTNSENGNWDVASAQYQRFKHLYNLIKNQVEQAGQKYSWVLI